MDKFGIFNLLNSFFTPTAINQEQNGNENNPSSQSSSPLNADFLSNLFSSSSTPKNQPIPQQNQVKVAPLQSNMLCTITNHDNLVKRVKSKYKG